MNPPDFSNPVIVSDALLALLAGASDDERVQRVTAALNNPAGVHMRDRLAAALRHSTVGMFEPTPRWTLGFFMFHNNRYRDTWTAQADRFLSACDGLGLRITDELHDPERML